MRYRESDGFVVRMKARNAAGVKEATHGSGVGEHRPFTAAENRWNENTARSWNQ
jgi:hypothetical protein